MDRRESWACRVCPASQVRKHSVQFARERLDVVIDRDRNYDIKGYSL